MDGYDGELWTLVLNVKAVVAAFNQEKALVRAFSVLTNLRMELFQALVSAQVDADRPFCHLVQN